MVPKIHAKGSSFKGAAAYLLHDKDRADTSERVAWTEARNLAVDDPDMGWRIMAATALDQNRLKAEAGVKSTGRKSSKHVLHISLAWHPDQAPEPAEMAAAADQAMAAIGAKDHQALFIAHSDEEHAHVHLLINRVSPEDGRLLPSSNDRLKLSKWAEGYEREGGQIYCEDRVVNNALRAQGAYVKGAKDIARHIFEAAPPANDNDRDQAVRAAERAKDHALSLRGRNMAAMQARAWEQLEAAHTVRKDALARQLERETAKAKAAVLEEFRPTWRKLHREQEAERRTFASLEESLFGRASNIVRTLRASAKDIGGERSGFISRSFGILTNAGARKAAFETAQERAQKAVERDQAAKQGQAAENLKAAYTANLGAHRAHFLKERDDLAKVQAAERARLQVEWRDRTSEREAALSALAARSKQRAALKSAQTKAAKRDDDPRAALLERYARSIAFKRAAPERAPEQDNERGRDFDQADD